MKVRAVIFDLGGVLVRTEDPRSRNELAARLGLTPSELSDLVFDKDSARLATVGKATTREHWESVREALQMSPEEFPAVPVAFWGGDFLDQDLVGYIRSLRPRFRTGLLSNAWDNLRHVLTHHWKIADAFDDIVISAEVGLAKPDPRVYMLAVDRLGVAPEETVFVDDFLDNIESARAVGLQTVHFLSPTQVRQDLAVILEESGHNN